jgi:hypothetical protein
LLEDLDISPDLSSVGAPKADHPAYVTSIHEGDAVQGGRARRESQDPSLPVVPPVIDPQQGGVPVEPGCEGQGYAMLVDVEMVFVRVELESRALWWLQNRHLSRELDAHA